MELYTTISFLFHSILVAALFWTAYIEKGKDRKWIVLSSVIILLLYGIRFAPWLIGAEWRSFIRSKMNYAIVLILVSWGCFILNRYRYAWRSLLAICAFVISACLLICQNKYRPHDCVIYHDPVPAAILEITHDDSTRRFDYYRYINNIFRGKESDDSLGLPDQAVP